MHRCGRLAVPRAVLARCARRCRPTLPAAARRRPRHRARHPRACPRCRPPRRLAPPAAAGTPRAQPRTRPARGPPGDAARAWPIRTGSRSRARLCACVHGRGGVGWERGDGRGKRGEGSVSKIAESRSLIAPWNRKRGIHPLTIGCACYPVGVARVDERAVEGLGAPGLRVRSDVLPRPRRAQRALRICAHHHRAVACGACAHVRKGGLEGRRGQGGERGRGRTEDAVEEDVAGVKQRARGQRAAQHRQPRRHAHSATTRLQATCWVVRRMRRTCTWNAAGPYHGRLTLPTLLSSFSSLHTGCTHGAARRGLYEYIDAWCGWGATRQDGLTGRRPCQGRCEAKAGCGGGRGRRPGSAQGRPPRRVSG